jgi:tRNA threonylcarbamoyladenosine biosynthesis protein TsaE
MKTYTASNLEELTPLINDIHTSYKNGIVILLQGTLGSGKTTLVQHFIRLTTNIKNVTSPTFSLMHEYTPQHFHYDIYRIGSDDFIKRGLGENFEQSGFHFVEWADEKIEKLLDIYGIAYITISITINKDTRTYKVSHAHA